MITIRLRASLASLPLLLPAIVLPAVLPLAASEPTYGQSPARAASLPARIAIPPLTQRVTHLPETVQAVTAAPDGRVWYQLRPPVLASASPFAGEGYPDIDTLQDLIEREYNQPAPQMAWTSPRLFEAANGKVTRTWFVVSGSALPGGGQSALLLGYDGRRWIEHAAPTSVYGGGSGTNAVALAGTAFFSTPYGVLMYNGKSWGEQDLRANRSDQAATQLYPDPVGKSLLAVCRNTSSNTPSEALWRWQDGTWTRLAWEGIRAPITAAAPTRDGLWVFCTSSSSAPGSLHFVRYSDPAPAEEDPPTATLVEQLKTPATAEAALKILKTRRDALPRLDEALRQMPSSSFAPVPSAVRRTPAAEANPREVLSQYRAEVAASQPPMPIATGVDKVGDFELSVPTMLLPLPDGRALLMARLRDPARGRAFTGLLLLGPDGAWSRFDIDPSLLPGSSGGPLRTHLTADGKRLWIGSSVGGPSSTILLDLQTRQVLFRLPVSGYQHLHTVTGTGQAFVNTRIGLLAINPDRPDDRTLLRGSDPVRIAAAWLATSDNGHVWARTPEGLPRRFDSKQGQPPDENARPNGALVLGRDGAAVCELAAGWALQTKDKTYQAGTLEDLLAGNAAAAAAAFRGPLPTAHYFNNAFALQADGAKHLWLVRSNQVKVLIDGVWRDATDAYRQVQQPTPPEQVRVTFLTVVGDGSKVLLCDTGNSTPCALGQVVEGKVIFTKLFRWAQDSSIPHPLIGPEGELWTRSGGSGGADSGGLASAVRLTAQGITNRVPNASPTVVDHSGVAWLRQYPTAADGPASRTRMLLWHKGKTGELTVPSYLLNSDARFFAGKPGTVYAWTDMLLTRFVAPPDQPTAYRLEKTFWLDGLEGYISQADMTAAGDLLVVTYRNEPQTTYYLHRFETAP